MADRYWALADLRYPASDEDYVKATTRKKDGTWPVAGTDYKEVSVGAGNPLTGADEKVIESYLSMGRDVISTKPPKLSDPVVKAEKAKVVKT
jgi:hypothetical protein